MFILKVSRVFLLVGWEFSWSQSFGSFGKRHQNVASYNSYAQKVHFGINPHRSSRYKCSCDVRFDQRMNTRNEKRIKKRIIEENK